MQGRRACAQDGEVYHTVIQAFFCLAQKKAFDLSGGITVAKRIGVIGIVINEPKLVVDKVNAIISQYGQLVVGRMGIPRHDDNVGVIALIIEGTTDEVGALTGKLGNLPGVTVKSALTAKTITQEDKRHD
jgi:putative iron-only hydrogenase system regulator